MLFTHLLMVAREPRYEDNPIPPEDGLPSVFTLTHFWIWGNSGPPKPLRCNDEGILPLPFGSDITLTLTPTL